MHRILQIYLPLATSSLTILSAPATFVLFLAILAPVFFAFLSALVEVWPIPQVSDEQVAAVAAKLMAGLVQTANSDPCEEAFVRSGWLPAH